jgi:ACS family hexuronate transporter-like MFS transporter
MRNILNSWRWWVCILLLLATMVNYMDRLTLNLLADPILRDLGFGEDRYGQIESAFALAFAGGAIFFGFLVDRVGVYWVYPAAVLVWSAAGFCSGLATGFESMIVFRVMLGLAESANWPCALRVTQRVLSREERSMGNSILQSGTAVGSIALPLVLKFLYVEGETGAWRMPFFVVGAAGAAWVILWFGTIRREDLDRPRDQESVGVTGLPSIPAGRYLARFIALVILVITTNMTWHFLRAWGPLFLQRVHGYSQDQVNNFFIGYYVLSDIGAIAAGALTLYLASRWLPVHASRMVVYLGFALIAGLTLLLPYLEGTQLLVVFLVVGFGALGVFPNYYSFTQDLTERHQGKLTGTLSCACWIALAIWQWWIGGHVKATGSYLLPMVIAGIAPLLGFMAMIVLWGPPGDAKILPEPPNPTSGTVSTGIAKDATSNLYSNSEQRPG